MPEKNNQHRLIIECQLPNNCPPFFEFEIRAKAL